VGRLVHGLLGGRQLPALDPAGDEHVGEQVQALDQEAAGEPAPQSWTMGVMPSSPSWVTNPSTTRECSAMV
jgi:hypothetical protein